MLFKSAFQRVRRAEEASNRHVKARIRASRAILECGLWLTTFSYGCWSIIYVVGAITWAGEFDDGFPICEVNKVLSKSGKRAEWRVCVCMSSSSSCRWERVSQG